MPSINAQKEVFSKAKLVSAIDSELEVCKKDTKFIQAYVALVNGTWIADDVSPRGILEWVFDGYKVQVKLNAYADEEEERDSERDDDDDDYEDDDNDDYVDEEEEEDDFEVPPKKSAKAKEEQRVMKEHNIRKVDFSSRKGMEDEELVFPFAVDIVKVSTGETFFLECAASPIKGGEFYIDGFGTSPTSLVNFEQLAEPLQNELYAFFHTLRIDDSLARLVLEYNTKADSLDVEQSLSQILSFFSLKDSK